MIDFLYRNWETLKSAPLVFISFAILIIFPLWFLISHIYKERIETLKERLAAKDDQINEYRQRLHLVDREKTAYSQLTNNELQDKASKLISRMREYHKEKDKRNSKINDVYRQRMIQAKTDQEREMIWTEQTSLLLGPSVNLEYGEKFKADAIILRDELLSRLPKDKKNEDLHFYEYPTNPLGLQRVIDDLEKLSKSLPK
ncbi:MAG: hypothetical protein FJ134_06160 [Deltaproteobacteria bacterium]|nr:hypothetical protein [Deltaproteobacteria bacterium]